MMALSDSATSTLLKAPKALSRQACTQEVMRDPVLCDTYERTAITAWLAAHGTSPKTHERLSDKKEPVPIHALRNIIASVLSG